MHRSAILIFLVILICFETSRALSEQVSLPAVSPELENILQEMRRTDIEFDPLPLYRMGTEGMAALMDVLIPESAGVGGKNVDLDQVRLLGKQLGDIEFSTRESAMRKLIELGPPVREHMRELTHNKDPEIAWRATTVLEKTEPVPVKGDGSKTFALTRQYSKALSIYLAGLKDPLSLRLLALRVTAAMERGRNILDNANDALYQSVVTIAQHGDDHIIDLLSPLLDLQSEAQAALLINLIGANRPKDFVPGLLRRAQRSPRKPISQMANIWMADTADANLTGDDVKVIPFKFSSSEKVTWAFVGSYSGECRIYPGIVEIIIKEGRVARGAVNPNVPQQVEYLRFNLGVSGGNNGSWDSLFKGNQIIMKNMPSKDGEQFDVANSRFVIQLPKAIDLSKHWLIAEIGVRTFGPNGTVGTCYAHSERTIFRDLPTK